MTLLSIFGETNSKISNKKCRHSIRRNLRNFYTPQMPSLVKLKNNARMPMVLVSVAASFLLVPKQSKKS